MEQNSQNQHLRRRGLLFFIIVLAVILIIAFLGNRGSTTTLFSNPYLFVITPFKNAYGQAINYFSFRLDKYLFLTEVFEENLRLKDQIVKLSMENHQLAEEKKELFRRLNNMKELETYKNEVGIDFPFLEASVINKNFTGFTSSIVINKGSDHGIRKNMPVLNEGGIIGKTYEVSGSFTKVILINDLRSSVDVILEESRHNGVVTGTGKANSLLLKYIEKDFTVVPGEKIIASGYGGIFPKGLVVGTVKDVSGDIFGLFKEISVIPLVNLKKIENVTVLLTGEGNMAEKEKAETPATEETNTDKPEEVQ